MLSIADYLEFQSEASEEIDPFVVRLAKTYTVRIGVDKGKPLSIYVDVTKHSLEAAPEFMEKTINHYVTSSLSKAFSERFGLYHGSEVLDYKTLQPIGNPSTE